MIGVYLGRRGRLYRYANATVGLLSGRYHFFVSPIITHVPTVRVPILWAATPVPPNGLTVNREY